MPSQNSNPGFLDLLGRLGRQYPMAGLRVITLLLISGLAEGVGIASLLPLLTVAFQDQASAPEGAAGYLTRLLSQFGLTPSLNILLVIIVLALGLKAAAFLLAMRDAGYAGARIASDLRMQLIDALASAEWRFFAEHPIGSMPSPPASRL